MDELLEDTYVIDTEGVERMRITADGAWMIGSPCVFTQPPTPDKVITWPADMKWPGPTDAYDPADLNKDFFIPADERKIMSSRTPSHEFLIEKRAENDLRRRNEGKRILSSRT